jgi:HIT domain-containing protein
MTSAAGLPPDECPFCTTPDPRMVVYDDPVTYAVIDIAPINPCHALVIPKAHYTTFTDLPRDLVSAMFGRRPASLRCPPDCVPAQRDHSRLRRRRHRTRLQPDRPFQGACHPPSREQSCSSRLEPSRAPAARRTGAVRPRTSRGPSMTCRGSVSGARRGRRRWTAREGAPSLDTRQSGLLYCRNI